MIVRLLEMHVATGLVYNLSLSILWQIQLTTKRNFLIRNSLIVPQPLLLSI